jgi:putative aminopeptidase FrvX
MKFKYVGETDISNGDIRTYEGKTIPVDGVIEFTKPHFIEKAKKSVNYEELNEEENIDDGAEIRERAKELGIGSYWNKKIDNLLEEIEQKEAATAAAKEGKEQD